MKYYLKAFKNMTDFAGRANNNEWWYFVMFNIIFSVTAMVLDIILGIGSGFGNGPISKVYAVVVLIPGLALSVRRLHDVGKSGLYIFLVLIPVIGIIWLLFIFTEEGHSGKNQYGLKPKETKKEKKHNK